jgi:hypothetical protein
MILLWLRDRETVGTIGTPCPSVSGVAPGVLAASAVVVGTLNAAPTTGVLAVSAAVVGTLNSAPAAAGSLTLIPVSVCSS